MAKHVLMSFSCDNCKKQNLSAESVVQIAEQETGESIPSAAGCGREYETVDRDLCPACAARLIKKFATLLVLHGYKDVMMDVFQNRK